MGGLLIKVAALRPGERPEHVWRAIANESLPPGRRNLERAIHLFVLLTDQRLILVEREGFLHRHLEPFDQLELETVKSVTVKERFVGNAITIAVETVNGIRKIKLTELMETDQATMKRRDYADVVGVQSLLGLSMERRRRQLIDQTRSGTSKGAIDFNTIRERMAQSGLVVNIMKCPNCQNGLELPMSGHEARCHHCQATIRAEDLLARIKDTGWG
jgi:hypothetical protein